MTTLLHSDRTAAPADLHQAAALLVTWLTGLIDAEPVVVAVAPAALPLAAEIAAALHAPLDTVSVEPLTFDSPVERFGVAGEGGIVLFDPDRRDRVDASAEAVDAAVLAADARIQRRSALWREGRRPRSLRGRTVLLVADRLVDERSAAAAACAVRDRGAAHIVYVVRRAQLDPVLAVEDWVDEVLGLELVDDDTTPADRAGAAGQALVSDETVRQLLRQNHDALQAARQHTHR